MVQPKIIKPYEYIHIQKKIRFEKMDPNNIVSLIKTDRNYRVCVFCDKEYHDFKMPIIPTPTPKRKSTRKKTTTKAKRKKLKVPPLGTLTDRIVNIVFIITVAFLIYCWMTAGN